ncbi:MAG: GntR family transcriptional regulator [Velocimicrobium sp.]
MIVEIDFNSDEAIYIQLRNQIVIGIATAEIREGESLPSVRDLAEHIGINMHTVNKAYSILKQEGYLQLDRRKGAIIALDPEKYDARLAMMEDLRVILAEGICKEISCEEVHRIVDLVFREFKREV